MCMCVFVQSMLGFGCTHNLQQIVTTAIYKYDHHNPIGEVGFVVVVVIKTIADFSSYRGEFWNFINSWRAGIMFCSSVSREN